MEISTVLNRKKICKKYANFKILRTGAAVHRSSWKDYSEERRDSVNFAQKKKRFVGESVFNKIEHPAKVFVYFTWDTRDS